MTCRESRLNSALTTFARCMTGLADNQVLSLSHSIQDELPESSVNATVTNEEWNLFIDATLAQYASGALYITSGSADPRRRLEAARSETPDARRLHAARHIIQRCARAQEGQRVFLEQYDRVMGLSAGSGAEVFANVFAMATRSASLAPTAEYERGFRLNPDNSSLFTDRRSLFAYEAMQHNIVAHMNETSTVPTVTRTQVESSVIREVGYNVDTNRLEVVMHSNPDRVYAYRVPARTFDELMHSDSVGSYYSRHIRGNSRYLYSTTTEAEETAVRARCSTCGQWADEGHTCPVSGSIEEEHLELQTAIARVRARTTGQPVTPVIPPARMQNLRTRRHMFGQGSLRMPSATRIQQEARRSTNVLVPVIYATSDGNTTQGDVQVHYNGRGQGYAVTRLFDEGNGNGGVYNLRCSCAEYRRNYHCSHTDAVVVNTAIMLNPTVDPHIVRAANIIVSEEVAADHAASVTAIEQSAASWAGLHTSFEEDPTVFQQMYDDARNARALHKDNPTTVPYPVPYLTENVFGGIGKRGSSRGFGIEIEYSYPQGIGWSERSAANARIGRELRELRLTQSDRMGYYGETHGWFRDQHEEGWAFEEDGSTIGGGEVISPVMYDEPETWENIQKVTDILERNGAIPTHNAGLHVHVGIADYDHTIDNHNRLLVALAENEDIVYRLSANPETGRHRGITYCSPNDHPSRPYTALNRVSYDNAGHDLALNMESVHGDVGDNVEFRTFDSSLKPGVIQAQIGMSLYMTEGALRPGTVETATLEPHPLGEQRAAHQDDSGRMRPLAGEAWKQSTQGFRKFLDMFLPGTTEDDADNPQVKQMVSLFAMTRWQRQRWQ